MAEAAVTIFLDNMWQLETYHADLISGAEDDLQLLKNDLALLKAFLRDEAKKPAEEREMESRIKEVVYEVEDEIGACLAEAAAAKAKNLLRRHLRKPEISLDGKVKSLRQGQVKELLDEVKRYNSTSRVSDATSTSVVQLRTRETTERTIKNDKVVGMEDEEETITGFLMEQKEKLDVISIIGMAGLGKTALARKIYKSTRIASEFQTRIWVHVSQKLKARDVHLSILKRFTREDMSVLNDEELYDAARACLEKEKFLLVLDNVCSFEDWEAIKSVLPCSNGKGKILITSREDRVGEDGNASREPHKLRALRLEESCELLQLEVFGNLEDCRHELVEVGQDIAHKCDGVPLQILAVAGILKDLLTIKGWKKVSENVSLLNVLEVAYIMLPDELRECFLYMGVFPEDCEISVWTLIRLWIAEGFVQPTHGKCLEEIATQKLDHLIARNLVMVDEINFNGEVKTCRFHDMIRAFCITKSKEQNLFQEIRELEATEVQKFDRLCFHSDLSTFPSENPQGPHVRSFLCFYEQTHKLEPQFIPTIPKNFPKLRILESKGIKFNEFLAKVTKLIHLRYLTLC